MANQELSYYDLLQVSPHACKEVIEAAYRALQKQMHPDQGGDTELAQVINRAKEVLIDPKERNRYDTRMRIGTAETFKPRERVIERVVEKTFAICLTCQTKNRVNLDRLESGKCGHCGTPFIQQGEAAPGASPVTASEPHSNDNFSGTVATDAPSSPAGTRFSKVDYWGLAVLLVALLAFAFGGQNQP